MLELSHVNHQINSLVKRVSNNEKERRKVRIELKWLRQVKVVMESIKESRLKKDRELVMAKLKVADDLIALVPDSYYTKKQAVKEIKKEHNYSNLKRQLKILNYILND
jgi:hypothetical protein